MSEKCDFCGEIITGETFPVYDENYNLQEGLNQCEKCFAPQKPMITEQDKKDFDFCVKAQIEIFETINAVLYKNIELNKVLIDINLETIENLKMLIS